jgi:flagellin-like protein
MTVGPRCGSSRSSDRRRERAQSSVVGVAVLLGATLVAIGVLTASVGTVVDSYAARADAGRVATDLDDAVQPLETTGAHSARIRFTEGSLTTVERDLRVQENGTTVAEVAIGGLVYARDDRRVRSVAGSILRGRGEGAWTVEPPPVAGSTATDVLVISATKLNASASAVGGGVVTTTLATNVSHERRSLGTGEFAIAIETAAPVALASAMRERGARSVERSDLDGDGVPSVIATFPETRSGYLIVHDMRLAVSDG